MTDTATKQAVQTTQQTFPTTEMRQAIVDEIFADTKRELSILPLPKDAREQAKAPEINDEVVDRVLAALGVTQSGQTVRVTNEILHEAMRAVHSDTNRALIQLGQDPEMFHEPAVYCHEDQQFRTVRSIVQATGGDALRSYTYY